MDKKSDIPREGDPVIITAKEGFFLSGVKGIIVDIDTKTYIATIKLDKPIQNEEKIPVHLNKLESLE
ncbi:MAG: hypothetical protein PHR61_01395 [Candidatus Absconditabacteria bacterium]|nr:hypothetical protein [Candidatus Absconditabacteria bacterium]